MRPAASSSGSTRSTRHAPGTSVGSPTGVGRADDELGRLVLRAQRARAPRPRPSRAPTCPRSSRDTTPRAAPAAAPRRGARKPSASRRATAFVKPAARSRPASRTSSTASSATAYAGGLAPGQLVAGDPQCRHAPAGSSLRTGRRPSSSMPWSIVRMRCTVPYAIRCASARSRASSPSAADAARGRRTRSSSKTRRTTSKAARRAGAITRECRAGTRRTPCGALPSGCTSTGTNAPSSSRARQIVTRRPCSSVHAPMCGESARTRSQASTRIVEVRARGRPARSSRRRSRPPRAAARSAASGAPRRSGRAATSAERAKSVPASSSGAIGNVSCAAIGPASSAATVSWIVTPVSVVAGEDRALDRRGAAPARQQRRVHVEPERLVEQRLRDRAARRRRSTITSTGSSGSAGFSGWSTGMPSRSATSFVAVGASLRPRPRGASGRVSR